MVFTDPAILGALLLFTDEPEAREKIILEAESTLEAGCVGHNYYWFYQRAMESALRHREWQNLEKFIDALRKI